VTEPTDGQRDGSGRDRLAQTGPETEPQMQGAAVDEAAPDASADVARSDEASVDYAGDASVNDAGDPSVNDTGEASVNDTGEDPVADDPDQANGQVAAALAELDAAAGWPPADQVAAFTAAHETLQATLARIDDH